MLAVTILGNNSAVPAFDRHPTSQIVTMDGMQFLVDCGEGTQIQLMKYKIRRGRISHIFISHLHGDHYFGLIGLLNSFGLLGHQQELHVYAPEPLQEIIELQLRVADTRMNFPLHFHAITGAAVLVDLEKIEISCFPVQHRVECYGFLFREKRKPRKLLPDSVRQNDIPLHFYERLKDGEDFVSSAGERILNDWLTMPATPGRQYAFCADTRYFEEIVPYIQGVDLLYHESTYLDTLRERAFERFHSTSVQAAMIAKLANAGRLLLGHFSSKYDTLGEFETEARAVFPNTDLALEGVSYRA